MSVYQFFRIDLILVILINYSAFSLYNGLKILFFAHPSVTQVLLSGF